jgi:hypothetical protein
MNECATTTVNLFTFKTFTFEINEQKTPNVPERLGYVFTSGLCRLPLQTSTGRTKVNYRGADKSLARPGRKQATTIEDFDVHISYL